LPPEPLSPTEDPAPVPATAPPTAPTRSDASTGAWQTYRDDQAGYSIAYPPDWTAREQSRGNGSSVVTFTPDSGRPGVMVIVQDGVPNAAEPSDLPNTRCQQVTIGGLAGTRCLDTISFSIATTLVGQTKTYIITTSGKNADKQIYQSVVNSFALL
jgi:hypothetical protein